MKIMNCTEFDATPNLQGVIKNLQLLLLPSPQWAIHTDQKCENIVILHVEFGSFERLLLDKAVLITYDQLQNSIKTAVLIHNEVMSIPSLQYTVGSIDDLSQLVYNLENLTLCRNSDNTLEYPQCSKYVKADGMEGLCCTCGTKDEFYEYAEIGNFNCNANIEPILNNYIDNSYIEIVKNDLMEENFTCSHCNEIFALATDLNMHLELKHIPIKNCQELNRGDEAEKILLERSDRKIDTVKGRDRIKSYICPTCNKSTRHRSSHYKHLLSHQSDSKSNLCNVCGKTFSRGYKMENHILTHTDEKPYECLLCNKSYASKNNLRIHEQSHKGNRPYICKVCHKSFTTPSNLSTHTKSIHKKVKPHQCGACKMSFLYPQLLKLHMRTHTGEKPYKCDTCAKAFAKKIHLTVHERTHTGEKPFICSICGKGFTTSGNLGSHKKVHSKEAAADR